MLQINDVSISVDDKTIIQNLNLSVSSGQIHAIMGPNGSGKSTLAYSLMGHPWYQFKSGTVLFDNEDLIDMTPDKRSRQGLFLAFQQPLSIPGVTVFQFLKEIYYAAGKSHLEVSDFKKMVEGFFKQVGLDDSFLYRGLHENFSGGEKKRLEVVQMLLLEPKLIMLDEIDSGLDVDALKLIGKAISDYLDSNKDASCIIITHYRPILDYVKPDFVHIMHKGNIVHSGDDQLSHEIEQKGYDAYCK